MCVQRVRQYCVLPSTSLACKTLYVLTRVPQTQEAGHFLCCLLLLSKHTTPLEISKSLALPAALTSREKKFVPVLDSPQEELNGVTDPACVCFPGRPQPHVVAGVGSAASGLSIPPIAPSEHDAQVSSPGSLAPKECSPSALPLPTPEGPCSRVEDCPSE